MMRAYMSTIYMSKMFINRYIYMYIHNNDAEFNITAEIHTAHSSS